MTRRTSHVDPDYDAAEQAAEVAAARCEFQLTYARSPIRRMFGAGMLDGPNIPDAYRPGTTSPGEWLGGDGIESGITDPDEWVNRFASYAVNEAVHEALEWMRVDGGPWLDPHGPAEDVIYAAVNALCDRLAAIRREWAPR